MNLSKLWEIVKDREAWHAAVDEVAKNRTQLNNSNNIPLCMCTTFHCICVHAYVSMHFSVDGHLGCFHVLPSNACLSHSSININFYSNNNNNKMHAGGQ